MRPAKYGGLTAREIAATYLNAVIWDALTDPEALDELVDLFGAPVGAIRPFLWDMADNTDAWAALAAIRRELDRLTASNLTDLDLDRLRELAEPPSLEHEEVK